MTLPSIIGVAVANAGTGGTANADFTSTGRVAGDFLILIDETPNRPITTPTGWTAFTTSQQSTGTAGSSGSVRLGAYWKISDGTETTVNASSSTGNHAVITGIVLRGTDPTTPVNVTVGGVITPAGTAISFPSVTTTVNDCLILNLLGSALDAAASNLMSSVTNAGLANLTVQFDKTTNADVGGGCGIITGELATAGSSGSTTATYAGSTNFAVITVAIAGVSSGGGITGTLTGTQDDNTLSASGGTLISGSLSGTQDSQTLSATGTVSGAAITGTLSATQAANTLTASGTVAQPTITGTLNATQASNMLSAQGQSGAAVVDTHDPGMLSRYRKKRQRDDDLETKRVAARIDDARDLRDKIQDLVSPLPKLPRPILTTVKTTLAKLPEVAAQAEDQEEEAIVLRFIEEEQALLAHLIDTLERLAA